MFLCVFTALHGMQMRSSDENSVRASVCLSVCQSHACGLWQKVERYVQIFIPYERSFSLVYWEEEWLVGATLCTWNFGSTGPCWSKFVDFQPIIARSASAITLIAKKVQLTLIESPLRAFQWAWGDRRTLPLSPPKGVSKTQNDRFPSKIALRLKKVSLLQSFFVW